MEEDLHIWLEISKIGSKNVFHISFTVRAWKSIFDHFINKAWAHAGASQAEALDLTMDCELQCPWQQ